MPPSTEDRFYDIQRAIARIEQITSNMTFEQFAADIVMRAATERFLEVVCEASRKLPDTIKQEAPEVEWRKMVNFGNVLRHAYHSTKVDLVWNIVTADLPTLKSFVERALKK